MKIITPLKNVLQNKMLFYDLKSKVLKRRKKITKKDAVS